MASAEDYDSTVELIEPHHPTLLFTDVRMPPTSTDEGIRLARWMRTAHPDIGVIVLSQYADPRYATGLLDGGTAARGYLLKERVSHFDQLSEAVHQVAAGGTVLDPLVVEALLAQPSSAATLSRLTPREREVLAELATGLSNRTVAQRLVLTQRAVEKHINSIFAKLGLTVDDSVDRRVKAVLMFLDDHGSAPRSDVHTIESVVCTPSCATNQRRIIRKMADERVRVWVVDDQASFRLATAATVAATEDFVMAGDCESGESAMELIPDGSAGIVLMDIHMPGMGGIEATRRIRAAHPDMIVLLTSTYDIEDLPAGGRRLAAPRPTCTKNT